MNLKSLILNLSVAASLSTALQGANLVLNGSFEVNNTLSSNITNNNYVPGTIPNWTLQGTSPGATFNALYDYGTVPGALPLLMPASYNSCTTILGFVTGASCANPDGTGHFVNLDGDPNFPTAISQALNGLVLNRQYTLTFSWAAVQRSDQSGATTANFLDVSLGNQHFLTNSLNLPAGGFSGWLTTNINFTWNGVGNQLTFLAHGNPAGLPPTINLDGVALNDTPEPASWQMLVGGLAIGLIGMTISRRRRQTVTAN